MNKSIFIVIPFFWVPCRIACSPPRGAPWIATIYSSGLNQLALIGIQATIAIFWCSTHCNRKALGQRIWVYQFNIEGISLAKYQFLQRILTKYDVAAIQETHAADRDQPLLRRNYKDSICLGLYVITFMAPWALSDLLLKMLSYAVPNVYLVPYDKEINMSTLCHTIKK